MGIDAHVNPLWADLSSTGTITTRYFTGDIPGSNNTNSVLARSQVNGGSTATAWLGTDRQGSVRDILDPTSGNLQDSLTYSAFGAITSQSNASWTGSITYTGLIFDANSGMLFAKYRALNPATGQWLSEDPLGLTAGDPNVRRYAGNNTENAQDGSGLRENNAQDYERKKLHWFGNDLWYYSRGGNWYYVGSKLVYKGITYNDRIERTVPTSNGPTQYWAPFGDILAESQDTYTTGDWDRFFRRYGQPVGQMTVGPRHDYVSTEENVSNAVAGFGDTVTMGGTQQIRQLVGIDDIINYGSEEYIGGAIVGTGVNGALGNGWGVAYGASTIAGSYGNWGLQNPNSPNNIMGDTGNHLLSLVGKTGQAVSGVRGWGGWLGKASKSGYGWVAIPGIGIPTWNAGKGLYNATGNWGQLSGWDRAELLIPLAAGIGTGVRYGRSDYVNARGPLPSPQKPIIAQSPESFAEFIDTPGNLPGSGLDFPGSSFWHWRRRVILNIANGFQKLSNSNRPRTIAVLETMFGDFVGRSRSGSEIHPVVQDILNNNPVPEGVPNYNRQCAEINAISNALFSYENSNNTQISTQTQAKAIFQNSTILTARVRKLGHPDHGTPIDPCDGTCAKLLNALGIRYIP